MHKQQEDLQMNKTINIWTDGAANRLKEKKVRNAHVIGMGIAAAVIEL
jgi:hypothetical protein